MTGMSIGGCNKTPQIDREYKYWHFKEAMNEWLTALL